MTNPPNDERLPTPEDLEREARRLERLRRLRVVTDDGEPERRFVLVPDFDPGPKEAA